MFDDEIDFPHLPAELPPQAQEAVNAVEGELVETLQSLLARVTGGVLKLNGNRSSGVHKRKRQHALQVGVFKAGAIQERIDLAHRGDGARVVVVSPRFSPIKELVIGIGLEDERLFFRSNSDVLGGNVDVLRIV